jgi:23S rRNA (uracil747-C5)-methyltransferase
VRCDYYEAGACRSCTLLEQPYEAQVAGKQAQVVELLDSLPGAGRVDWRDPVLSAQEGFRNKAKMVVTGTVDAPTLGILDAAGAGVDLRGCPLHVPAIREALPVLAEHVRRARLTPYDIAARRGELKHVLVTASPDGELMVRWVLRSDEAVPRLRKHRAALEADLPGLRVQTANVQPEPKAVLEGEREIVVSDDDWLAMRLAGLELRLRPRSFFQTNTGVATALYEQARAWVDETAPSSLWDLYCGVGGFALACAAPGRDVLGVEVSDEAVHAAQQAAAVTGSAARFEVGDATLTAGAAPELVVVNPPRRGLGPELTGWLEASGVQTVLYSSCNAESLVRDLRAVPALRPVRAQLFDMFPHTRHHEVLVLLQR